MEIIKAIIYILKQKKKKIYFLFFLLSGLFIANYMTADRIYISDIKLAHNSSDGSGNSSDLSGIFSSLSSGGDGSVGSSTTNFDMIPEVLSSRSFLNEILEREFSYNGKIEKLYLLYSKDKGSDPFIPLLKLDGRKKLLESISVRKNLNNPVIYISISTNDKKLSFDLASAVLEQLESDLTNFQLERINQKIEVINNQIESSLIELTKSEEDLRKFRVNNSNIIQSPTLRMQESSMLRDILVLSNTYSSLKIELEITKIKYFEEANVLQVIDPPNLPLKKSGPRLRYMLISLIASFSFIVLFYVYAIIFLRTNLGKEMKKNFSSIRG